MMNLDSLPIDVMLEILSRLCAKSIGRCRCVSKQWGSMLVREDFKELFLTKSSARPRLLFVVEHIYGEDAIIFSTAQLHQNPIDIKSSPSPLEVVVSDFDTKMSKRTWMEFSYAAGLMYFPKVMLVTNTITSPIICNPMTGQYTKLPQIDDTDDHGVCYLGFDPIDKQFKVLYCFDNGDHKILTVGGNMMRWRKIQSNSPFKNRPNSLVGICINGVLYYLFQENLASDEVIVCFDVRSETFKYIVGKFDSIAGFSYDIIDYTNKLINYKGRLGVINWMPAGSYSYGVLCLWVLEDIELQKWSKYVYHLPSIQIDWPHCVSIVGMTSTTNDIILMDHCDLEAYSRFDVFYFNPDMNTLQHVHIYTTDYDLPSNRAYPGAFAFVDHVEDFCNFDIFNKTFTR